MRTGRANAHLQGWFFSILVLLSSLATAQDPTIDDVLSEKAIMWRSALSIGAEQRFCFAVSGAHSESIPPDSHFSQHGLTQETAGSSLLMGAHDGTVRHPFGPEATAFAPAWSPDGLSLAAVVARPGEPLCVGFWDQTQGARYISAARVAPATGWSRPEWLPDGSGVIMATIPNSSNSEPAVGVTVTRNKIPLPDSGAALRVQSISDEPATDISSISLRDGSVRVLSSNLKPVCWRISPNGQQVAIASLLPPLTLKPDEPSHYEIRIATTQTSVVLAPHVAATWGPAMAWSPDGKYVAWMNAKEVALATIATGKIQTIPHSEEAKIDTTGDSAEASPPRWSVNNDFLMFLASDGLMRCRAIDGVLQDPEVLLAGTYTWATTGEYNVPSRPVVDRLWLLDGKKLISCNVTDGSVISRRDIPLYDNAQETTEALWVSDSQAITRLSFTEAPPTSAYSIANSSHFSAKITRTLTWSMFDTEVSGVVRLPNTPPPSEAGYPTVIYVYPGSEGEDTCGIDDVRLWTAAGYAVFFPSLPLRGGLTRMKDLQAGIQSASDALMHSGLADQQRLAIIGESYGMYAVLSAITDDHRYACAVVLNGVVDLALFYQQDSVAWCETGQAELGVTPWQNPSAYLDNSPWWKLDAVTTPILSMDGSGDPYFMTHGRALFVALQRLDKPIERRIYPGGGHAMSSWPALHRRDGSAALLRWFDTYLKRSDAKK